ncbi:hypothetical protein ASD15_29860 [Massilia sp. Root351]|jgi:hypothetical protein|uniref:hypothetical protein n=1 Tax=Massilia sp. Root351 TaxID=1736522 RepID=UPI00070986E7|nr:hypothetical protein [Massilia sp. Root351]KQV86277.1 hypothetical protein ASD15_29860 [Massilia sp. Root351]
MDEQQRRQFINEVWQRFEEVQNWAIANWPDRGRPLSSSDFVEARKEILALGLTGDARLDHPAQAGEPEPEQGGAQYIEVTPAPWP